MDGYKNDNCSSYSSNSSIDKRNNSSRGGHSILLFKERKRDNSLKNHSFFPSLGGRKTGSFHCHLLELNLLPLETLEAILLLPRILSINESR